MPPFDVQRTRFRRQSVARAIARRTSLTNVLPSPDTFLPGGKSAGPATGRQARRVSLPAFSGSPLRGVLTHRLAMSLPRKRGGLCQSAGRVTFAADVFTMAGNASLADILPLAACVLPRRQERRASNRSPGEAGFAAGVFRLAIAERFDTPLSCVLAAEAGACYAEAPGG